MKDAKDHIDKLPFWNDLSADEKAYVEGCARIRRYEKGHHIHSCAKSCLGLIHVITGRIRVYLLSEEGREVTLYHINEGENCVLSSSCVIRQITFETHMAAEQDCELLVVNSGAFKKLVDTNINVRCFQYELITERFSSVVWVLQRVLFDRFDSRLAAFLLEISAKHGVEEVRMTQEQIAVHINSAREVVARMLKQFASDGIVEVKRGVIKIIDRDRLEEIAG